MFGVVSLSLHPKTPTESQLMSSTVMMRTFGLAAKRAPAQAKTATIRKQQELRMAAVRTQARAAHFSAHRAQLRSTRLCQGKKRTARATARLLWAPSLAA